MRRTLQILFFLLSGLIISSCATSNSVVSTSLIQKRKYNSGWFVKNGLQKTKKSSDTKVVENSSHFKVQKEDRIAVTNQKHLHNKSIKKDTTAEPLNSVSTSIDIKTIFISDQIVGQNINVNPKPHEEEVLTEKATNSPTFVEHTNYEPEKTNKVAVFSFIFLIASISFLAIGFIVMIESEMFVILSVGLLFFLTSLILSIIALTKYEHLEKRKILAKITLYTIIIAPILLLIIGILTYDGIY